MLFCCRPSYCINYKVLFKHPHCKHTWADQLDPKKPICVECQHEAMNKHGRCKGHGLFGEATLWEAVDLKSCYGGWLKIGPKIPNCKCDNQEFNNFIFILRLWQHLTFVRLVEYNHGNHFRLFNYCDLRYSYISRVN